MSCWKLRVHGCCFVVKFFPLSCRQTSAEWNPLYGEKVHSQSSRNVVLDLFRNINKTQKIIHLEIITTHLYHDGFPSVSTSAIKQALNPSHRGSVQTEASVLSMAQQHQPLSCSGCCLWGRGPGRRWQASCLPVQKVHPPAAGGGLGAPWRICLVWAGMQCCPREVTNHRGADKVLKIGYLHSKIIKKITFCILPIT